MLEHAPPFEHVRDAAAHPLGRPERQQIGGVEKDVAAAHLATLGPQQATDRLEHCDSGPEAWTECCYAA